MERRSLASHPKGKNAGHIIVALAPIVIDLQTVEFVKTRRSESINSTDMSGNRFVVFFRILNVLLRSGRIVDNEMAFMLNYVVRGMKQQEC